MRLNGLIIILLTGTLLSSVVGVMPPVMSDKAHTDTLEQFVIQQMSGLPGEPDERCLWSHQHIDQYIETRTTTLTHLLSRPEAEAYSIDELLIIFTASIQQATGTADGAYLLTERDGSYIVSMNLPRCAHRLRLLPEAVVLNRDGNALSLGHGIPQQVEWFDDRWVFVQKIAVSGGYPYAYHLRHLIPMGESWEYLRFPSRNEHLLSWPDSYRTTSHGPGLTYVHGDPVWEYIDGYHLVAYTLENTSLNPNMPCDFSGQLDERPQVAAYSGTIMYRWQGERYVFVLDAPFHAHIRLSNSFLPDENITDEDPSPYVQSISWRAYCEELQPEPPTVADQFELLQPFTPTYPCELRYEDAHVPRGNRNYWEYAHEYIAAEGEGVVFIRHWYQLGSASRYGLSVCDLTTGQRVRLVEEAWVTQPTLPASPNGEWVAFHTVVVPGLSSHVYKIRSDGTGFQRLDTQGLPHLHVTDIMWSDDGEWVFISIWGGEAGIHYVYRLKADGSGDYEPMSDNPFPPRTEG